MERDITALEPGRIRYDASVMRILLIATVGLAAFAQGPRGPVVISPEVGEDRKVTFRLLAPAAEKVTLGRGDIPGTGPGPEMTKGEDGIWSVTVGPLVPGAYRYNFNVGGVNVIDPRNPVHSESNDNLWSMVAVPGSELMDTRKVPHGAVAAVTYYSSTLNRFRRMHVYTPPGYESGKDKYPVFYLLHGASDSDDSWSSVGRAGFILDNLIADKKAKPMIVVMPAGHTTGGGYRMPTNRDDFSNDFSTDIMPYVDSHYRVQTGREHRAVAGLSMGGSQTLNLLFMNPEKFAYAGVFSSGLLNVFRVQRGPAPSTPPPTPEEVLRKWEQDNAKALSNTNFKKGLKLLWFSIGKDDFLLEPDRKTVELLKKHGFNPINEETEGGHTWLNWRDYLGKFAPQLFQ